MIDDLSVAAAKLLLSMLYRKRVTMRRRQRERAMRELEDAGWISVTRRRPKPALITLLHLPPGVRQISDSDLIRFDSDTSVTIISNLSNRSTRAEATEPDELEPVSPSLVPLMRHPVTQFNASSSDAIEGVNASSSDAMSANASSSDAMNASSNDVITPNASISDAIEAADRMVVNASEGYNIGSSFWQRRAEQLSLLMAVWGVLFPKAPMVTQEQAKKYLRITGDQAMPVYEMFVRASKAKKPIEYPATYIEKALLREKSSTPRWTAPAPAKSDAEEEYYKPYDGELEELTPEELEERRAWQDQIKNMRRVR